MISAGTTSPTTLTPSEEVESMENNTKGNNIVFDAIKIGMASPEQIRAWSHGEVKKLRPSTTAP